MNAPLACAATARLLKSPGGSSPAGRRGALTALREPRPVAPDRPAGADRPSVVWGR